MRCTLFVLTCSEVLLRGQNWV